MNSDFPLFERSASASEIKLDLGDSNDIKALSEYFEKSRDELQKVYFFNQFSLKVIEIFNFKYLILKKVDSIFAIDLIEKNKVSLQKEKSEISLRSNSVLSDNSSFGRPIDIHTATVSYFTYLI